MSDNHNSLLKKHLSLVMRVGVAIFACWLVAREMNFGDIANLFVKSWLVVLQAVIIFTFCQGLIALRWWLLMRAWGIHIGFWSSIKLTFMGLYFNNFLPGAVGGDFVRAWYVSKYTNRRMASVISVFMDRILALFATIIMAGTAVLLGGQKGMFTRQKKADIIQMLSDGRYLVFVVILTIILVLGVLLVFPAGRRIFKSLLKRVLHYSSKAFEQAVDAGKMLLKKPYLLPESLCITFTLQTFAIIAFWLVGRQMGITTELKMYFIFFPLIWVIGSIPISIAGIGIVEGGLIVLFMQFGMLPAELKSAVGALVLSQRAVWLVASLPGLAIYLFGEHLPKGLGE